MFTVEEATDLIARMQAKVDLTRGEASAAQQPQAVQQTAEPCCTR